MRAYVQAGGRDDDGCARGHFKPLHICEKLAILCYLVWTGLQLRFASTLPGRLPMMSSLAFMFETAFCRTPAVSGQVGIRPGRLNLWDALVLSTLVVDKLLNHVSDEFNASLQQRRRVLFSSLVCLLCYSVLVETISRLWRFSRVGFQKCAILTNCTAGDVCVCCICMIFSVAGSASKSGPQWAGIHVRFFYRAGLCGESVLAVGHVR